MGVGEGSAEFRVAVLLNHEWTLMNTNVVGE